MNRESVYFTGLKRVEVREEGVPVLRPEQVLVRTLFSAISAGTELLIYRQQIPQQQPADTVIQSLSGNFQFPLKYGYSTVGKVVQVGQKIDSEWLGKEVFAFHSHESLFTADLHELMEIPKNVSTLDALFLPNMETAANFVMDGCPVLGENVAVFGQGIVGLLTTAILSRFPLHNLITLDKYSMRRQVSKRLGAKISLDPGDRESFLQIKSIFQDKCSSGADLTYEISGSADALTQAIEVTGFGGRVVIGSWYGSKPVSLKLDTNFHRSRIQLISSQVSTIAASLSGRWNKPRRFQTVWRLLEEIKPAQFITRSIPIDRTPEAYRILDENPEEVIQIILTYPDD